MHTRQEENNQTHLKSLIWLSLIAYATDSHEDSSKKQATIHAERRPGLSEHRHREPITGSSDAKHLWGAWERWEV